MSIGEPLQDDDQIFAAGILRERRGLACPPPASRSPPSVCPSAFAGVGGRSPTPGCIGLAQRSRNPFPSRIRETMLSTRRSRVLVCFALET